LRWQREISFVRREGTLEKGVERERKPHKKERLSPQTPTKKGRPPLALGDSSPYHRGPERVGEGSKARKVSDFPASTEPSQKSMELRETGAPADHQEKKGKRKRPSRLQPTVPMNRRRQNRLREMEEVSVLGSKERGAQRR